MIVRILLRLEIGGDVVALVSGGDPFIRVRVADAIGLEARRIRRSPQRQILAAKMCRRAPHRLLLLRIGVDGLHHVDAPAEIRHVGRIVRAGRQFVPLAGLGVVDVVGARQDVEPKDVADGRRVARHRHRPDVTPPGEQRPRPGQELLEGGGAGIGVELVGRLVGQTVDHVLDRPYPARVVDARLHRVDVEQPCLVVGVLDVGGGAALQEIEAESAPALGRVEIAVEVLALELLALEELVNHGDLLPGLRRTPVALVSGVLPGLGEIGIGEDVGTVVHGVAIAVDASPIDFAVPSADRRPEVVDVVVREVDQLLHPVGHFRREALAEDIALEGSTHLGDVEIDRAGCDRLVQARVVVGLREIDPGDLGTGIGLPRLQEAAEQEVVHVLVVEPHESEFDALEFTGLDGGFGAPEAKLADLLPIGVSRGTVPGAGNLHDLLAQCQFVCRHVRGPCRLR